MTENDTSTGGVEREQKLRGPCGFRTSWWDVDAAYRKAKRHARRCDVCEFGEIEYQEREKEGSNCSDTADIPPGPTCSACGSGNVPGAVECGGCGGALPP